MIGRGVLAIAVIGGLGAAAAAGPFEDGSMMGVPDANVPGDAFQMMMPDAFEPPDAFVPMLPDAFVPIPDASGPLPDGPITPLPDGPITPLPDGPITSPDARIDADPSAPDADPSAPDADPTAPDAPPGGGPDADADLGLTNYYACGCNSDTGLATGAMILLVLFLPFRTRGAR